jgi:uncharacterized damage-inducible protein DinB
MGPRIQRHFGRMPRGHSNAEAASFVAQFDDLSRRLREDLAGASAAELAWQPHPGANTIGMLLAHVAIVEVFWMQRATTGVDEVQFRRVLGIGRDDDGIPCPPGARAPNMLRGWTLADYHTLEARGRRFTKRLARGFRDADMERRARARTRDGRVRVFNVRWILCHMLEHDAGHFGQMLLLRHLYRECRRKH